MSTFNLPKLAAAAMVAGLCASGAAQAATAFLTLPYARLQALNSDWTRAHEAYPMGVPGGYDWYAKPAVHKWNSPGTFLATTGWGQVFYMKDAKPTTNVVQIRNFQTLMCYGPTRKWVLLQKGGIEGAQFRADFAANLAVAAPLFIKKDDETSIGFALGSAFHWWPAMGRATIPDPASVCGVVVLMEGRVSLPPATTTTTAAALDAAKAADAILPNTYLIGAGVDYWATKTAVWDNYKTNSDLGVGRLRIVTKDWQWFGLGSATEADLLNLYQNGYDTGAFK